MSSQLNLALLGRSTVVMTTSFIVSISSGDSLKIQFASTSTNGSINISGSGTTQTSASISILRML